ncbi:MAG: hypothetical protein M3O50_17995 [Myxococcota bacterium]|nr:hypothetical protein [Myxococcota bacterium]
MYSTGLPTDVRLEFDAYTPPPPSPDLQSEPLSGYVYDANPGILSTPAWRSPYYGLNAASGNGPGLVVHREDAGDGTVPAVSAMCPGLLLARPAECAGAIQHADVYKDPGYQAAALKMIRMLLAVPPGTKLAP